MFDISAPYLTRDPAWNGLDTDTIAERVFAARKVLVARDGLGISSIAAVNDPASLLVTDLAPLQPAAGRVKAAPANPHLDRLGLTVFEVAGPPVGRQAGVIVAVSLNGFRRALLRYEADQIQQCLAVISKFSKTRKFGNQVMATISSVKIRIGQIYEAITLLREMTEVDCKMAEDEILFLHIKQLLDGACESLARLAGGRSMLQGGPVEMKYVFNLANQIYL